NNYVSWSAGVGSAGTGVIPAGQSFFVKSNAASPVLEMNNDIRIHDEQAYYKNSTKMIPEVLHLHISDAESADEIIVRFASMIGNKPGLFDVDKLYGAESAPQLYSISEINDKLTINALDHSSQTIIVPVGLEYSKNGQLEFLASGFESFESSASIFLEDKLLNKMIDLRESPSYLFNHNTTNDALRFNLHFSGVTTTGEVTKDDYHIWSVSNQLNINIPACSGQNAMIEVFDLLGHRIYSEQKVLQTPTEINLAHFNGMALVRVTTDNKIYSEKVFIR
ncbi:MAG: T9SS type A sorting domain-containing protein, partial [Bacteroidales bacterium]|nr:T9SS type A sorting domain-containing protein [Bacteroidales bacterium]